MASCYAALGAIHGSYHTMPGRFKDYISTPKSNGYRSLHTTILGPESRKIEVQIRTAEMHEQADLGVAAHWGYKQNAKITEGRRYRWIRELLDILEHASDPEDFLENTKLEMFQDQVFCFSPKGDLIALPRGATPVDFAYAVHSEVGDRCVGAKIDGRMVQLRTQLHNGDQVEIITSKNSTPSPEWDRFVVTGKARARIRRFARAQQRDQHLAQGREALQRAARSEQLTVTERLLEKALDPLHQRSVDDLHVAVGDGTLTTRAVLEALHPELKRREQRGDIAARVVTLRRPSDAASRHGRQGHAAARPGTRHRLSLRRLLPAGAGRCHRGRDPDRAPGERAPGRVRRAHPLRPRGLAEPCRWRGTRRAHPSRVSARLVVSTLNKPGSLGSISTVVGKQGGNITDVRIGRRATDIYEMLLDVEVESLDHLRRVQAALRATPCVTAVERGHA